MTLIIAWDRPGDAKAVEQACRAAVAVKLGLPLVIQTRGRAVYDARRMCDGMVIADLKLADIGATMKSIVDSIPGVDGVIAHAFVGVEGALDELKEHLDSKGVGLYLLVSMSHPGSRDVIDQAIDRLFDVAEKVDPLGLVAPATRPGIVRMARDRFPDKVIISPGVGAQGARPGDALCAGANYEIVGRAITRSGNPLERALEIRRMQEVALRYCR